ncbi:unnamed protein product [Candidula unifasciata]|uniref:Mitochondrial nucleoid factor 1 n=1 Tax=Candidula unifasciata TaxID=100452 RepID=A0A8S3YK86_9EUPU|nr:unnamed protein product [Candidula unifasciata]
MATSRYRNFLRLLEQWPVDKSREKRDLGAFVRRRVVEGFSHGEATQINAAECDKVYESLHRINTDFHLRTWRRSKETNASGATAEALRTTLSDAGLKELSGQYVEGPFSRLKEQISKRET